MSIITKKKVLIVGGLGLIGEKTTDIFLKNKNDVVCIDLKKKSKYLRNFKKNKNFNFYYCDVTKIKNLIRILKKILKKHGAPDIFINCSYPRDVRFDQSDISSLAYNNYSKHINMHLNSYVWLSKLVAIEMKNRNINGSIINLSSIYGLVAQDSSLYLNTGIKENLTYAVIKSGIIGATKLISSIYGKFGIRANCVCPAGIEREDKYSQRVKNYKFRKNFTERVPLRRFATASDVAEAILFLSSDKASYITGISLPVDGGWTAI